jgi:hypothetical protein
VGQAAAQRQSDGQRLLRGRQVRALVVLATPVMTPAADYLCMHPVLTANQNFGPPFIHCHLSDDYVTLHRVNLQSCA